MIMIFSCFVVNTLNTTRNLFSFVELFASPLLFFNPLKNSGCMHNIPRPDNREFHLLQIQESEKT